MRLIYKIKQSDKNYWFLAGIAIVLLLLIRLFFKDTFLDIYHNACCYDSRSYIRACKTFYYSIYNFEIRSETSRPLGMALVYGVPLLLKMSDAFITLVWAPIINGILFIISALLCYRIAQFFVFKKLAFRVSLLYLATISILVYAQFLLSEMLFITLFLGMFLCFFLGRNNKSYLFMGLFLACFLVLVKPVFKFLLLIILVMYFSRIRKQLFTKTAIPLYVGVFLLLYQLVAMKNSTGVATLTFIDTKTLHNYFLAQADAIGNNSSWDEENIARYCTLKEVPLIEKKEVVFNSLLTELKQNPEHLFKAYVKQVWYNSTSGNKAIYSIKNYDNRTALQFLNILTHIQNTIYSLFALLLGVYVLLQLKQKHILTKEDYLLFLSPLYLLVLAGISYNQADRMHIIFFPIVLLALTKIFSVNKKFLDN